MHIASIGLGIGIGYSIGIDAAGAVLFNRETLDDAMDELDSGPILAGWLLLVSTVAWPWMLYEIARDGRAGIRP